MIYRTILFIIAAALLIAALLLSKGETGWLYTFERAAYKDKLQYAKFLGRILAYIALAMIVSGLASFLNLTLAVILLIAGVIASIVYCVKKAPDYYK